MHTWLHCVDQSILIWLLLNHHAHHSICASIPAEIYDGNALREDVRREETVFMKHTIARSSFKKSKSILSHGKYTSKGKVEVCWGFSQPINEDWFVIHLFEIDSRGISFDEVRIASAAK